MGDDKLVLTYFNSRGRAEMLRILMKYADIPFEDKRIGKEEWEHLKPSERHFFGERFLLCVNLTFLFAQRDTFWCKSDLVFCLPSPLFLQTCFLLLSPEVPTGQLPMLEVNGTKLCQSVAIGRFLADKAGIAGKTRLEQAQSEVVVHTINDVVNSECRTGNKSIAPWEPCSCEAC